MICDFIYEPIYNTDFKKDRNSFCVNSVDVDNLDVNNVDIKRKATEDERKGTCFNYAISTIVESNKYLNLNLYYCFGGGQTSSICIETYFEQTIKPKTMDLVLYTHGLYNHEINHYAVFITNDLFESKWGHDKYIRLHKPFDVPKCYGNAISFWTLKKEYINNKKGMINNVNNDVTNYYNGQHIFNTIQSVLVFVLGVAISSVIIEHY